MKLELIVIFITGFFIINLYYENKYIDILKSWKKYYQMGGMAFAGLSTYLFLKKYPNDTRTLLQSVGGVITQLPIEKNTQDFLSPFITNSQYIKPQIKRMLNSGNHNINNSNNNNIKRSVSETKKKYVASQQNWTCKMCKKQLPAWFEVDHKIRLDSGGSNNVDNLVALCRDCHGKKTSMENL
jgi:hypothetical protein